MYLPVYPPVYPPDLTRVAREVAQTGVRDYVHNNAAHSSSSSNLSQHWTERQITQNSELIGEIAINMVFRPRWGARCDSLAILASVSGQL